MLKARDRQGLGALYVRPALPSVARLIGADEYARVLMDDEYYLLMEAIICHGLMLKEQFGPAQETLLWEQAFKSSAQRAERCGNGGESEQRIGATQ